MNTKEGRKGLVFGIPGVLLQTGSQVAVWKLTFATAVISSKSPANLSRIYWSLEAVSLVGVLLLIIGLRHYAKAKGYAAAFGFLGFLGIIGVLIMVLLPDKSRV